jgi:hypothetical protein
MGEESEPPNGRANAPTASDMDGLEQFRRSPQPYLHRGDETRKPSAGWLAPSSDRPTHHTLSDADGRKRRKASSTSQSPSESGTEADDEGGSFVKALPPPPLRPRKGLRDTQGVGLGAVSPLLTPSQIDNEGRRFAEEYFTVKNRSRKGQLLAADEEDRAARQKYLKRRRNELLRRTTEVAELAAIAILTVSGCGCWDSLLQWRKGGKNYPNLQHSAN